MSLATLHLYKYERLFRPQPNSTSFSLVLGHIQTRFPISFLLELYIRKVALSALMSYSYGGSTSLNITFLLCKVSFFYFLTRPLSF